MYHNPVLMVARNCLHYTKEALRSLLGQTVPIDLWVLNQGSTDGTVEWLNSLNDERVTVSHHYPQFRALAGAWNYGLRTLLRDHEYALVVNHDLVLRPDTYERLLGHARSARRGFVTAVSVDDRARLDSGEVGPERVGERPHPDFSCFLITREVFRTIGAFDEHFIPAFREDQDYHRRMKLAGIEAVCIDVPFLHYASGTVKNDPKDAREVALWDAFRQDYYVKKWGALWPNETYEIPFNNKEHRCDVCHLH